MDSDITCLTVFFLFKIEYLFTVYLTRCTIYLFVVNVNLNVFFNSHFHYNITEFYNLFQGTQNPKKSSFYSTVQYYYSTSFLLQYSTYSVLT